MIRTPVAALVASALMACGGSSSGPDDGAVASVTLAPDSAVNGRGATVSKTSTLTLVVTLRDANGNVLPTADHSVTYASSDEAVATVNDGTVLAVGAGTTTISATSNGKSASARITVPWRLTQIDGHNLPTQNVTSGRLAFYGDATYERVTLWTGGPQVKTGTYSVVTSQVMLTGSENGLGILSGPVLKVKFGAPPAPPEYTYLR